MKNKIIRIVIAVFGLLLLTYAYFGESHTTFSLSNSSESMKLNGPAFTETTTFDGLMLKEGKIYDIYSLTPEVLQEKDCST
jgi:hypothetical protein